MLEIWEAERPDAVMLGRTQPVVFECVQCKDDLQPAPPGAILAGMSSIPRRTSFVTKSLGRNVHETTLFNEAFGCFLARELGVPAPKPALILLKPDFVNLPHVTLRKYDIRLRAGYGVGSEYFAPSYAPARSLHVQYPKLSEVNIDQAVRLYAFDLLVQNRDRGTERPNCAIRGHAIMAFDFETCFDFLSPIGRTRPAWRVDRHEIASRHIFYNELRRLAPEVDFQPFLKDLSELSIERLDLCAKVLPSTWTNQADQVIRHIIEVQERIDAFAHGLELSVA